MSIRHLILAATMLATTPALAQEVRSRTDSAAQAIAIAGGGGSGYSEQHLSGSYTVRSAVPIQQSFGLGTCVAAVQGGLSGPGFGIGLGFGQEDQACTRRNNAAALHALGRSDAALALMAQDASVAKALEDTAPRPAAQPAATPVATGDSSVLRVPAPACGGMEKRGNRWVRQPRC